MRLLNLVGWPAILVFALGGGAAVGFAFVTVNLFAETMASVDFVERHGLMALREGALVQLTELAAWGALALVLYLVFKACEVELVFRYFQWARNLDGGMPGRRHLRFRRRDDGGET